MRMNWVQTFERMVTNARSSKFFGSTTVQFTFVKILNSSAMRKSSLFEDNP